MGEKETEQQAGKLVDEYALFLYAQAIEVYQRELHGDGCGCPTCTRNAYNTLEWAQGFLFSGFTTTAIVPHEPVENNLLLPPEYYDENGDLINPEDLV